MAQHILQPTPGVTVTVTVEEHALPTPTDRRQFTLDMLNTLRFDTEKPQHLEEGTLYADLTSTPVVFREVGSVSADEWECPDPSMMLVRHTDGTHAFVKRGQEMLIVQPEE